MAPVSVRGAVKGSLSAKGSGPDTPCIADVSVYKHVDDDKFVESEFSLPFVPAVQRCVLRRGHGAGRENGLGRASVQLISIERNARATKSSFLAESRRGRARHGEECRVVGGGRARVNGRRAATGERCVRPGVAAVHRARVLAFGLSPTHGTNKSNEPLLPSPPSQIKLNNQQNNIPVAVSNSGSRRSSGTCAYKPPLSKDKRVRD